jgi:hypothetical protein
MKILASYEHGMRPYKSANGSSLKSKISSRFDKLEERFSRKNEKLQVSVNC